MSIRDDYIILYENYLKPLAQDLENHVKDNLKDLKRIDRVCGRAKSIESFILKSEKIISNKKKYPDPLNQIQDQLGVKVVTFYLDDIDIVSKIIEGYYRKIESKIIVPDSDSEFGYFGKHYILLIPDDLIRDEYNMSIIPNFFEIQIKTLFQHAWGEAEHDLGYKSNVVLESEIKRYIAFTAAQSWGADQIFNKLYKSSHKNCKLN